MPLQSTEQLLGQMSEFMNHRFFGKYRGIVTDVDDPDEMGRVKAKVPSLFEDEETPWAMPCSPFAGKGHGLFLLPEVDDGVWIEFEGGNPARPIWSGCWWPEGALPDPKTTKARVLATTAGHKLVLDDDASEVQLVHSGGGEIVMTDSDITITLGQSTIKITSSEINVNNGMLKITTAGASLVNDALKIGA